MGVPPSWASLCPFHRGLASCFSNAGSRFVQEYFWVQLQTELQTPAIYAYMVTYSSKRPRRSLPSRFPFLYLNLKKTHMDSVFLPCRCFLRLSPISKGKKLHTCNLQSPYSCLAVLFILCPRTISCILGAPASINYIQTQQMLFLFLSWEDEVSCFLGPPLSSEVICLAFLNLVFKK